MNKFYITTPIYYVNDVPHIGHAYTTMAADIVARYQRSLGKKVFFLTGTDEHGQKIARRAHQEDLEPIEFCNRIVAKFKELWQLLNISNDDFIRTTEKRHHLVCEQFFKKVWENGDIYQDTYAGLYCTGCESFKSEDDLIDGKCPDHNKEPEWLEEQDYFFAWTRYEESLKKLFQANPDFVKPESRYNEMLAFLNNGLKDIPITRSLIDWGIPVPVDKKQVLYVWFDALINYLTGIGYWQEGQEEKAVLFWPADIHLMAKDIISKHSLLWPAMLMAAGLEVPHKCFAHGFFTKDGMKISKSIGNVIDPFELVETFGVDAVRYFFFREFSFGDDGDYRRERLVKRYHADLANDLGNLVNRFLVMVHKFQNGKIDSPELTSLFRDKVISVRKQWNQNLAVLNFKSALADIWSFISELNSYIDHQKPWILAKKDKEKLAMVLADIGESLRQVAVLLYPFMPDTAGKIEQALLGKYYPEYGSHHPTYCQEINWGNLNLENKKLADSLNLFPRLEK